MTSLRIESIAALLLAGCTADPGAVLGDGGAPPASRVERYIRSDTDTRLVIEVDAVPGAEPRASVESDLVSRLSALLDKPDGITVVHGDPLTSRGADHAWTVQELQALGDESFADDSPPGTITMHVMWVDGHDAGDTDTGATLGLAWSNTHVAMYHDTIEANCGGLVLREQVCATSQLLILLHEIGHTIGLVDNGLPMTTAHKDSAHGAHDTNDQCIMYWAFEGQGGIDVIRNRVTGGGSMIDFDDACLADIAALRDR